MDHHTSFDKAVAIQIIRDVYATYEHKTTRKPRIVIAIGGMAMAMHGLRDSSGDVDLYIPDRRMASLAAEMEKEIGYPIDVTWKNTLWGSLKITDIESDAVVMEHALVNGETVDIAAVSVETLFILKTASMRPKDKQDLFILMPPATPQSVFGRFAQLWSQQEPHLAEQCLSDLAAEIQMVTRQPIALAYLDAIPEPVKTQWVTLLLEDFPCMVPTVA